MASKFEPYFEIVVEQRRRGNTFGSIANELEKQSGLSVDERKLRSWFVRRVERVKKIKCKLKQVEIESTPSHESGSHSPTGPGQKTSPSKTTKKTGREGDLPPLEFNKSSDDTNPFGSNS